jgi:trigger factor
LIMAVNVETLDKLERRITLTLAADTINDEVQSRLKRCRAPSRRRASGRARCRCRSSRSAMGTPVQYEVMNDKVGQAFQQATSEAKLRVAGAPTITRRRTPPKVRSHSTRPSRCYPEVKIGDLSTTAVEKVTTEVTDAGHRQDARHPAQAASHVHAAPGGRRRARRRPPWDHRLRRQDRRRAV